MRAAQSDPRGRIAGTTIGFVLFVGLLMFSIRGLIEQGADLTGRSLLLGLAMAPLGVHLSVLRFRMLTASLTAAPSYRDCASVVVLGGVANLLPLPGALMMRLHFLSGLVGARRSAIANFMAFCAWMFAASLVATLMTAAHAMPVAFGIVLSMTVLAGLGTYSCAKACGADARPLHAMLLLHLMQTTLEIVKAMVVADALGFDLSAVSASLLSLSSAVAAAAGFFPGGLGLTEALASGIAVALGFSMSLGIAVAASGRLIDWLGLALFLPMIRKGSATIGST